MATSAEARKETYRHRTSSKARSLARRLRAPYEPFPFERQPLLIQLGHTCKSHLSRFLGANVEGLLLRLREWTSPRIGRTYATERMSKLDVALKVSTIEELCSHLTHTGELIGELERVRDSIIQRISNADY